MEDRFIISPVNLELNLAPGESTTQQIMIVNRLGKTAKFKILKEDFVGSDDPEKITVFLGDESAGITSARDWMKPEMEEIVLNHGDRLTLPVNMAVPQNASAGSHYAALFASVSKERKAAKGKQGSAGEPGRMPFSHQCSRKKHRHWRSNGIQSGKGFLSQRPGRIQHGFQKYGQCLSESERGNNHQKFSRRDGRARSNQGLDCIVPIIPTAKGGVGQEVARWAATRRISMFFMAWEAI